MRAPALALLVALLLPGCLSAFDQPPEDPESMSYVLYADHPEKAAHPVRYGGDLGRLVTQGVSWTVSAAEVEVRSFFEVPEGAPHGAGGPVRLSVVGASGAVEAGDGTRHAFRDARVTLEADDPFRLTGEMDVSTSGRATFTAGRATFEPMGPGAADEEVGPLALRFTSEASSPRVRVSFDEGRPSGFEQGSEAVVHFAPGRVPASGATLAAAASGSLPFSAERSGWDLVDAGAPLTVRGAAQRPGSGYLDLTEARGSLDAGALFLDIEGMAVQWTRSGHPEFQAELGFEPRTETPVHVSRGSEAKFWLAVTETGRVGTAVGVRPRVFDEPEVRVGTGRDWYASPDPHVLEEVANAWKQAAFGWLIDFRITTFEPGETKYIPVFLEAKRDAQPGEVEVAIEFKGHNAVELFRLPVVID